MRFQPPIFTRLSTIRKSLAAIHDRLKGLDLRADWPTFAISKSKAPSTSNEIIYIQWLARNIAQHYRVQDITFVVSFNSRLLSAAQVEVRTASEIFIEYKSDGPLDHTEVLPIIAHEIAHIFLYRLYLTRSNSLENEILTDTAAIYLGFAPYFLAAQRQVSLNGFTSSSTTTFSVGYLSVDEIGYIAARRDYFTGENSSAHVSSSLGITGYRNGRSEFKKEVRKRPYARRNIIERVLRRLGREKERPSEPILFECICCYQTIRIPALHKKLLVTCPACKGKFSCFS
jgi:hypothetical protein